MTCDVCGLPDRYNGNGDGIGSCDCPRCECGAAAWSNFCICPPEDDPGYGDDYFDLKFENDPAAGQGHDYA